jgi:hypothetical protein
MIAQTAINPSTENRNRALAVDSRGAAPLKTSPRAEAWSEKPRSCKRLATRFRHNGFDYQQISRAANAAIFKQTWNGCSDPAVCYEIVRIREREGFEIGGRFVEPAEVYPNPGAWGVDGWTVGDRESAFRKFQEVVNSQTQTK